MSMLHVIRFLYIPFPVTDYSPDCKCSLSKVLTDRCLVNKGRKFFLPLSCKVLCANDLIVLLRVEWGELS